MITIKSLRCCTDTPDVPAVSELIYIRSQNSTASRTDVGLMEGPLKITDARHGSMLYLENGAVVYRPNPVPSLEECFIEYNDLWFKARVEFKSLE